MASNPVTGALYMLRGMRLLTRPGLKRYVLIPLLVNIVVFGGGIWLGAAGFEHLMDRMQASLPTWLAWVEWLLWPLFLMAVLVVVFYGFTLVANLLAAPFNGLLAEKVERMVTGRPLGDDMNWGTLLRELPATLGDEVRKLLYAVLWSVPFLILAFVVPVIGPLLWFLVSAWMLTLEYADFPMGNHGLKFRQMRATLRRRRLLSFGFGATTAALTAIPVVNFVVMPGAVAGATLMWVGELRGVAAET
ncbi:sulfate transporter CysZ [uncultured Thiohalocapsa sp.]|uniref:sulfate transporter CysZ n=1 Tax=uncultured Thiohalocapsa sp. TaxID=768990 RepID=UPI0025FD9A9C|nr:sulfate transporter CysZ [uncultured Thiohalocapsa sp.]